MQCAHQKNPTNFQRFTAVDFFSLFFSNVRLLFYFSDFFLAIQLFGNFVCVFRSFLPTSPILKYFCHFFSLIIAFQINAYVRRRINVPLFMNMRLMDWEKKKQFPFVIGHFDSLFGSSALNFYHQGLPSWWKMI